MSRIIRGWTPEQVDDAPVAPHRYRWDRDDDIDNDPSAMPIRDWKAAQPYQPGDVVYVQDGDDLRKARIMAVHVDYDRWDDRRPKFKVQYATKGGLWGKLFSYTYPGPIQRGYKLAGLAPEIPEGAL